MRRLLAIILAVLMLGSVCGTLIYNLVLPIYASEPDERLSLNSDADSLNIRVGLMYGSNVTVGFEVTTPNGFVVGSVATHTPELGFEQLWELDINKLSCTVDSNLGKTGMTYYKSSSGVVVGGWHAEAGDGMTREQAEELITRLEPIANALGTYAIPAYISGGYRVRIGCFDSSEGALALISQLNQNDSSLILTVAGPTDTAVSLVDPLTDRILFEYDCGDATELGLDAVNAPDGSEAYLVTPAQKTYDGVFMFSRYNASVSANAGTTDGVALTNVIKLGDYIKGVLPYEISNSWPLESQKAFAICVRSFTLSSLNRHESAYNVDLCNTTHCQVYNGTARINDTVERAVDETAGIVMSYDGEIVQAYYSAVSGGVTVSSADAWGGVVPYLQAVQTPWEIFTNHPYGQWTSEVSGSELCEYLRGKGYTTLNGSIASISIDSLAQNSTYIYQLTVTDIYGTSVTIQRSDTIRTALAKYVNSANFVVGKGSVTANITSFATDSVESTPVITAGGAASLTNSQTQSVISASGTTQVPNVEQFHYITSSGTGQLSYVNSTVTPTVIYASDANNFIFAGKGYGHGVGLSQIGLRDLANQGVAAADMLKLYFTGIEIKDYRS